MARDGVDTYERVLRVTLQLTTRQHMTNYPERVVVKFSFSPRIEQGVDLMPLTCVVAESVVWTLRDAWVNWGVSSPNSGACTAISDGLLVHNAGKYEITFAMHGCQFMLVLDGAVLTPTRTDSSQYASVYRYDSVDVGVNSVLRLFVRSPILPPGTPLTMRLLSS